MSLNLTAIFGPETVGEVEVVTPHIDPETDAEIAARFAVGDIDEYDAPPWDRSARLAELDDCPASAELESSAEPVPSDPFDRPEPNLWEMCQPPIHPRDPDRLERVLTVCDRCGSTDFVDIPIHDGQSTRRDCAKRHRFMGWPKWYGKIMTEESQVRPLPRDALKCS